jgi:hypothetical protein
VWTLRRAARPLARFLPRQPYWDCRCIHFCRLHLRFAFFGFQILDGLWFELRRMHASLLHCPHSPQRGIRSPVGRSRRARDGFGFLNGALCRCIQRTGRWICVVERPSHSGCRIIRRWHEWHRNPSSEWEAVVCEVPGLRYRSPKKEQPAAASSKGARCALGKQREGRSSTLRPIACPISLA